jgi:hypothetical protein
MKKYSLLNKKTKYILSIFTILFLIVGCVIIIYFNKQYYEPFMSISETYNKKKTLDRIKLQYLVNKYENCNRCDLGYIQPSNPCTHSFNTNFNPLY